MAVVSHRLHSYWMYFVGPTGSILGREDLHASGDASAMAMAAALFGACSDECSGFELWYGLRRVDVSMRQVPHQSLSQEMERTVIAREEGIRESRWAIAKSRRLLGQLAARKGQV